MTKSATKEAVVIDPLQVVVNEGAKLPSLPEVLLRLDRELAKDDVDLAKIGKLVGMDPVLSGQILRLANSAWYSRGGKPIQELSRALIRLGIPTTKELVHALVMPSLFPKRGGSIDMDAFWKHSFAVALFAQAIGRRRKLSREKLDLLWTAGLLHDIGALLLDLVATETYRRLIRICDQTADEGSEPLPIDLCALEREWLGTDHAIMGSIFLQKFWKLPEDIVWCVRYHEDLGWALDEPEALDSIVPIHVAVSLCDQNSVSWVPPRARQSVGLGEAWKRLGFGDDAVAEMAEEVEKAMEQAELMLRAS
ncbi:MAG: HDOD domain-containing protein [Fibrobacterota bacterium]